MKQNIIFLTIIGLFFSCHQVVKNNPKLQSIVQTIDDKKISKKSERLKLIEELKQLQVIFASNDKDKIADLFSFPISNSTMQIFIDDNLFYEQLEKNNGSITREMFSNYFSEISQSLQIDQINELFNNLQFEKLLSEDNIIYNERINSLPCYHYYGLNVENQNVIVTLGTDSNREFISKLVSEEILENDSTICEQVIWWVFTFDGNKLIFKKISGAG